MKWIPVSDRLPERGKDHYVLVTVRHKDPTYKGHDVTTAYYDTRDDCGDWKFITGYENMSQLYVSAWMPMPDPYRGEEQI